MSTEIADTKFGVNTHYENDEFFASEALVDTGAITSSVFRFCQTLGATEVKVVADGAFATGAAETVVISLQTSPTETGSFTEIDTATVAASTTIADGADVYRYIAPREEGDVYTKIVITSDFDATGNSVNGFTVGV